MKTLESLKITKLAFGAWAAGGWMWGGTDIKKATEAIEASIDAGVTSIDTAPVYGFGLSEEIIGKAIAGKREKVQILNKCGLRWDDTKGVFYFETKDNDGQTKRIYKYSGKQSIILECERSLKRLQIECIDLYQIHWPDDSTPISESMEALEILINQGKIKAAGVSNYSHDQMKEAHMNLEFASNQLPYSMLRRDIEEEIIPWASKNNIDIIAYSPLQRGILTGKIKAGHIFSDGDNRPATPYYKDENIIRINSFLDSIKNISENHNCTLGQLVLAWTMQQDGIGCVLVGARDTKQALENAKALQIKLTNEDLKTIDQQLNSLGSF